MTFQAPSRQKMVYEISFCFGKIEMNSEYEFTFRIKDLEE